MKPEHIDKLVVFCSANDMQLDNFTDVDQRALFDRCYSGGPVKFSTAPPLKNLMTQCQCPACASRGFVMLNSMTNSKKLYEEFKGFLPAGVANAGDILMWMQGEILKDGG